MRLSDLSGSFSYVLGAPLRVGKKAVNMLPLWGGKVSPQLDPEKGAVDPWTWKEVLAGAADVVLAVAETAGISLAVYYGTQALNGRFGASVDNGKTSLVPLGDGEAEGLRGVTYDFEVARAAVVAATDAAVVPTREVALRAGSSPTLAPKGPVITLPAGTHLDGMQDLPAQGYGVVFYHYTTGGQLLAQRVNATALVGNPVQVLSANYVGCDYHCLVSGGLNSLLLSNGDLVIEWSSSSPHNSMYIQKLNPSTLALVGSPVMFNTISSPAKMVAVPNSNFLVAGYNGGPNFYSQNLTLLNSYSPPYIYGNYIILIQPFSTSNGPAIFYATTQPASWYVFFDPQSFNATTGSVNLGSNLLDSGDLGMACAAMQIGQNEYVLYGHKSSDSSNSLNGEKYLFQSSYVSEVGAVSIPLTNMVRTSSGTGLAPDILDIKSLNVASPDQTQGVLTYTLYSGSVAGNTNTSHAYISQVAAGGASLAVSDIPVNSDLSKCQSYPVTSVRVNNDVWVAYNQFACSDTNGAAGQNTVATVQLWSTTLSPNPVSDVSSSSAVAIDSEVVVSSSSQEGPKASSSSSSQVVPKDVSSSSSQSSGITPHRSSDHSHDSAASKEPIASSQASVALGAGAIAGIAVGGSGALILGAAAAGLGIFACRKRRQGKGYAASMGRSESSVQLNYLSDTPASSPANLTLTDPASSSPTRSSAAFTPPKSKRCAVSGVADNGIKIIQLDELKEGSLLGQGGFGAVFRGTYRGSDVAIKKFNQDAFGCEGDAPIYEGDIMRKLQHPNVIQFYGSCYTDTGYMIVMELAKTTLASLIEQASKGQYTPTPELWGGIFKNIVDGMVFLHGNGVLHRDLKPANVLICAGDVAKLSDFGTARVTSDDGKNTKGVGTPIYMAPELGKKQAIYGKPADVYSFGIMLWEMATGKEPYRDIDNMFKVYSMVSEGKRLPIPDNVSPILNMLIGRCWAQESEVRPSFVAIQSEFGVLGGDKSILFNGCFPYQLENRRVAEVAPAEASAEAQRPSTLPLVPAGQQPQQQKRTKTLPHHLSPPMAGQLPPPPPPSPPLSSPLASDTQVLPYLPPPSRQTTRQATSSLRLFTGASEAPEAVVELRVGSLSQSAATNTM